ncbi:MAG: DEAD/DEAH box helicase family protein, partial [Ignavibacteriales bacterium]|nr:DEAD/DEAH box helicase family protein [Ignavibacteriales bacterium]
MESSVLYSITDSFDVEQIPTVWKNIDFNTFSEGKKLYPYQREALENALKILYKFYQNNSKKDNETLKKDFLKLAEHNGLIKEQQEKYFAYTNQESKAYEILSEYFEEESNQLPAFHFINRMSFWMATGSGKSIVLIKLIELLQDLMKNETIPQNEILFLTHRPDLIDQLKAHIIEFNQYTKREKGIEFIVRDL